MKRIDIQNNVEKARYMFELMPNEMPGLIEHMTNISDHVIADAENICARWKNPLLSAKQWIKLAGDIQTQLLRYTGKLKTARQFSLQLFDGYLGHFAAHCVQGYAHTHENKRFKALATLFFGYDADDWGDE
jgi:hypothetical protein